MGLRQSVGSLYTVNEFPMEGDNFSSPQTEQIESPSPEVNEAEPQAHGRHRTMEHLTLLRVDADSITGSQHSKKSFQSTLSNSAWDLRGMDKRSSNSLHRLKFGRRISSSEVCLDSVG